MNRSKKLFIIANEKISKRENGYYCDNIDMKSIPEGLNKNSKVFFIARKSKTDRSHKINLEKIKISSNLFGFLFTIIKTLKDKKSNYLLISITPFTFFAYILLFIFRKKTFVYLRSDGYEEYRAILGYIGPLIYHVMYIFITYKSDIIICQKRLAKKKNNIVFPSELDDNWLQNTIEPKLDKPKLLYVGRMKVEKGIFSLIKLLDKINEDIELSIVGKNESLVSNKNKINFLGYGYVASALIKIYDNHNISILPSFTEAHPKVIDESLARMRPVIIFEEISHIVQNRKGIFVSKRNVQSLKEKIKYIMKNYSGIQKDMFSNKLPMKKEFISQISKILV